MLNKYKNCVKIIGFIAVLAVLLAGVSKIVEPVIYQWNRANGNSLFYEQPEDTIEILFLGSSHVESSISSVELYENYGLCAYSLASSGQPVVVSYYKLMDAFDYQGDSLSTVVIDVSMLRGVEVSVGYEYSFLDMQNSSYKYEVIKGYADTLDNFISGVSTLFSYHSRWSELTENDFSSFYYNKVTSSRGYNLTIAQAISTYSYIELETLTYVELETDNGSTDEITKLDESTTAYLLKIIEFCEENSLELVLMKTPSTIWNDDLHKEVQMIAESYNLDFLDFNYLDLIEEIDYNVVADGYDTGHMNYYGATKFTAWMGNYLVENCDVTDVRGMDEYAFMEDELNAYYEYVLPIRWRETTTISEYLEEVAESGDYTIFLTVKDEASDSLTDELRLELQEFGLEELSLLEFRSSYVAVIENGEVVYEELQVADEENGTALKYTGTISEVVSYSLVSGGAVNGDLASITIDGEEYAMNYRGINIVVYDNESGKVVESIVFDTYLYSSRTPVNISTQLENLLNSGSTVADLTGDTLSLYLYNLKTEDDIKTKTLSNEIDSTELTEYLNEYWDDENYMVYLSSTQEVVSLLDEDTRIILSEMGLEVFSTLTEIDSYVAVIDGGNIVIEESTDQGALDITYLDSRLVGGIGETSTSSIIINGVEYSENSSGINVVIYNKITELVVDSRTFSAYVDEEATE